MCDSSPIAMATLQPASSSRLLVRRTSDVWLSFLSVMRCDAIGVLFQFQNGEHDNIMLLPHHTKLFRPRCSKYAPLGRRVTMYRTEDKYQLLTQHRRNNIAALPLHFFYFFCVKRHKDSIRASAYKHTLAHAYINRRKRKNTIIS